MLTPCRHCGERLRLRSRFCHRCGSDTGLARSKQRAASSEMRRERRHAWLFAVHLVIVITALVVPFFPFIIAAVRHEIGKAIGWGGIWWLVGTAVGSTLGCWDTFPRLSVLWRDDDPED